MAVVASPTPVLAWLTLGWGPGNPGSRMGSESQECFWSLLVGKSAQATATVAKLTVVARTETCLPGTVQQY